MEQDDKQINLPDMLAAVKRRYKLLLMVAASIFAIGVLLALLLPSIYRSQAVILIEQQEIPSDLVRSTVTSFAAQRIQITSQRVMSSTVLSDIMERFNLYESEKERMAKEEIIERMRDNISLDMISADVVDPRSGKPTEATIAFSLAFEDGNPQKAQQVANELVSLFLEENIKSRTESANETASFLDKEADNLRNRVREMEQRIAKFKDENANSRPELEELTRSLMNRTELHLSGIDQRLHETAQHKVYLEAEVAKLQPVLDELKPGALSALEQLRSVEAALSSAEASYGEKHPDVIRLKKQAESMRASVEPDAARLVYEQELASARTKLSGMLETYGPDYPELSTTRKQISNLQNKLAALPAAVPKQANNPAYLAMAARLAATNGEILSLRKRQEELSQKLDGYAKNLMAVPDADAEFKALNRDYDTALSKYREISAKQLEARVSQNLEQGRQGERFTLIEPPIRPELPAKPNRIALLLVSFILALLLGFGSVAVVELLDDKVRSRSDVQAVFGAPPLASIPLFGVEEGTSKASKIIIFVVAGIFISALLIHMFFMPLDVFVFVVLRKLGL